MLTGGINGFYQIVQELMKNVRIFITTSRARSKILSELDAAQRDPDQRGAIGGDAHLTIFYRCLDIAA